MVSPYRSSATLLPLQSEAVLVGLLLRQPDVAALVDEHGHSLVAGQARGLDVRIAQAAADALGRPLKLVPFETTYEKESTLTHEVAALLDVPDENPDPATVAEARSDLEVVKAAMAPVDSWLACELLRAEIWPVSSKAACASLKLAS